MKSDLIGNIAESLREEFYLQGRSQSPHEFVNFAIKISAGAGICFFLLCIMVLDFFTALFAAVLVCVCAFFAQIHLAKSKSLSEAREIEAVLPFALLRLGAELNSGMDFDLCVENIARAKYGTLSQKLQNQLGSAARSGLSIRHGILELSGRTKSREFTRALSYMVGAYDSKSGDGSGESLKRLGRELLLKRRSELREFSGKLTVLSLLFIALVAIVPALFESFVIVGSGFMDTGITPPQLIAITCLGFPIVNIALLAWIYFSTPQIMKTRVSE